MSMSQWLRDLAYGNLVQVADSIETGRLVPPFTAFSVSRHVPTEQCDQVAQELTRLYESGMQLSHLGYAALMHLQPETYTVETLAEKIGRSEKYVYARLRLTHLVEDVQQAFYAGKLTVAHAFEMARLEPEDQK